MGKTLASEPCLCPLPFSRQPGATGGARTVELRKAMPPPVLGLAPSWLIPAWVTGCGCSCGSPAVGGMGSRERPEAPSLLVAAVAGLCSATIEMVQIINSLVVMI